MLILHMLFNGGDLGSIVSNFSSISCFNSSKMTGVALVDGADAFRDGDEVLFVFFLVVTLLFFLF